ncbi:MAG: DNA primase [Muribaculaceae bacterium]|nr:DNA primase [Muribaculaceae bacterium]
MIDKATIQRIKDTANIVEVVGDYVHLTRRGANYIGLCPFHNERTPSFSVNSRRNFCYCFSCHKGGSPVNFIMEKEGISYHDALLQLAKKYGIKVEERELTDEEKEARTERESLMVASEWAMKRMQQDLRDTQEGREIGLSYLYERGVTDEAIKAFHLGYALDKSDYLTRAMLSTGFELDVLRKLSLTGVSGQGHTYDKYRGRVIFPIMNSAGKIVAFGGRDLKGAAAKYINSAESALYSKSHELYGIFQAKAEIQRADKCFLVEGYLDVISMWQSGLQNAVASSGTALTHEQINLIHRFTNNVTILYDGDNAGIHATLRAIDMLISHKINVKVLTLPDNHDPDSFSHINTPEQFRQYIEQHEVNVITYKMRMLLDQSANDIQKRAEAINSICMTIAHIHDEATRMVHIIEFSSTAGIPQQNIISIVNKCRIKVIEEYKRERELKADYGLRQADKETEKHKPAEEKNVVTDIKTELGSQQKLQSNPLKPLELDLMRLCVRYGFLPITDDSLVVEFIADELEADNISFTYQPLNKLLSCMLDMLDDYFDKLQEFESKLNITINEQREQGIQEIAARGLSIADIEREEKRLEERLDKTRQEELLLFRREYPSMIMASDADADIRNITTQLITDRHILSGIYTKTDQERPENQLYVSVPRAIVVLKNEILEMQTRKLINDISIAQQNNDWEKVKDLQLKVINMNKFRSGIAKTIGERIISPRLIPARKH